jgi:hypothetical protein
MIVLKAEQAARMQRSKDEEREAKESMLVSDIFSLFGSKDLCCSECHVIVLLCCYEFYMIVLKAEQATRMQRRKDEEREAKEHMLVSDFFFFFGIYI